MEKMKKKYRILIVMRWPIGGIRTFSKYVYSNFDESLFSFTLVAPDVEEVWLLAEALKSYEIRLITTKYKGEVAYISPWALLKVLLFETYDLIHSHGLSTGSLVSIPAKILGRPHIMTLHEVITKHQVSGIKGWCRRAIFHITMPFIQKLHHVSHDAKCSVLEHVPLLKRFPGKHIVIPNGVEIRDFSTTERRDYREDLQLPKNSFLIGFIGRFMKAKGFKYLIEAIEIMDAKDELPRLPVIICLGWGGFIREEQEVIRKKDLTRYFRFLPFTPNVGAFLKGVDVLAIPSVWEAFCLAAAEALVAGVPIIGTNCIGLREVLLHTPARVVPPQNSPALAEALLLEMKQSSQSKALSYIHTARERFDVRKQAKQLQNIILQMIHEYGKK